MRLEQLQVVAELGRGGMGVVWRARDRVTGREVAVKQLLEDDPQARARFRQEVEAMGRLRHPNLVAVHASGLDPQGRPYAILELVAGASLGARLKQGPLPPAEVARVVAGAARGIAHAHARGVLHRDLKPGNILVEAASGTPKVLDFGLAVAQGQAERLTRTGAFLGTPAYMAPEQLGDAKREVDARTDVYGLGATLYEALTGRRPYEGEGPAVLARILRGDPSPSASDARPDLPADLDAVCQRAMAKDPAARYPTADALADDLERFLRGEPTLARPLTAAERRGRWLRRRAGVLLAAAATTTALGVALAQVAEGLAAEAVEERRRALEAWVDEGQARLDSRRGRPLAEVLTTARVMAAPPAELASDPRLAALASEAARRGLAAARRRAALLAARAEALAATRPGPVAGRLGHAARALEGLAAGARGDAASGAGEGEALPARERAALLHLAAGRRAEAVEALAAAEADVPGAVLLAEAGGGNPAGLTAWPLHPRALALRVRAAPDAAAARAVVAPVSTRALALVGPDLARTGDAGAGRVLATWRECVGADPAARAPLAALALALDRPLLARLIAGALEAAPPAPAAAAVLARATWTWPLGLVAPRERLAAPEPGSSLAKDLARRIREVAAALDSKGSAHADAGEVAAAAEEHALAALARTVEDEAAPLVALRDAAELLGRAAAADGAAAPAAVQDGATRVRAVLGASATASAPLLAPGPTTRRVETTLALAARAEREQAAWALPVAWDEVDRALLPEVAGQARPRRPVEEQALVAREVAALRALAARLAARAGLPPPPPPPPLAALPPPLVAAWTDFVRVRSLQATASLVDLRARLEVVDPTQAEAEAARLVERWANRLGEEEATVRPRRAQDTRAPSTVVVGGGPAPEDQARVTAALEASLAARFGPGTVDVRPVEVAPREGGVLVAQRLRVSEQPQSGYAPARYVRLAREVEAAFRDVPGAGDDPIPGDSPVAELARAGRDYWHAFGSRFAPDDGGQAQLRQLLRATATGLYAREAVSSVVADKWNALPAVVGALAAVGDDAETRRLRAFGALLAVAGAVQPLDGVLDAAALAAARARLPRAVEDAEAALAAAPADVGAHVLAAQARLAQADAPGAALDRELDVALERTALVAHALPLIDGVNVQLLRAAALVGLGEDREAYSALGLAFSDELTWLMTNWDMWRAGLAGTYPDMARFAEGVSAVVQDLRARRAPAGR